MLLFLTFRVENIAYHPVLAKLLVYRECTCFPSFFEFLQTSKLVIPKLHFTQFNNGDTHAYINRIFLTKNFSLHHIFIMADISRCRLSSQNSGSYREVFIFWMFMDWRTALREGIYYFFLRK